MSAFPENVALRADATAPVEMLKMDPDLNVQIETTTDYTIGKIFERTT